MSDDDMPALDDFQQNLKAVQYSKPASKSEEDYTKPNVRHLEDEEKQNKEIKEIQKKVESITAKVESNKKPQSFGGFKKGFFSSTPKPKQQKITEVKATKANPLQFKEVQQAMKVNNYLQSTKSEWMTDNFLTSVQKNQKIQKLFSNPEYMKAIGEFQTNPKQAMAKYGGNKQFMEGFQEFCQLMGNQFQGLAKAQKK